MKFQRQPLRLAIRQEILTRLITGGLPAGKRINETHLAEDLGLSRTPLREAMLTLAATGHLAADMGKGFSAPPLTGGEWMALTEMLAILQPTLLARAQPVEPSALVDLANQLNRARLAVERHGEGPRAGQALAGLGINWTEILASECACPILGVTVQHLAERAARYWYQAGCAGLGRGDLMEALQGLYELIRQGKKDRACQVWAEQIGKVGQDVKDLLPLPD